MRKIAYYILAIPVYLLALLPFPLFYLFCDFLFLLGYYVIGYRRKVINQNLANAYPEKSAKERALIAKRYFRFMIDLFLESFKLLVMTKKEVKKRVVFTNMEVMHPFVEQKQSVIFVLGHYGNWEWCGQSFQIHFTGIQQDVLYHPLSSPFFEWLTYKLRTRWGVHPIPMNNAVKMMLGRKHVQTATAFLSDQTPSNKEGCYWLDFLNQDTPVFKGTEKLAVKFNRPVVFVHINRIKRGYYQSSFTLITDKPAEKPEGWITEQHTRLLEAEINHQPEYWLWSHRRWKHKRD